MRTAAFPNTRQHGDGRVELIDSTRIGASPLYNKDLAPVPVARRNWTTYNYAALWISMSVNILTYMLAASLIQGTDGNRGSSPTSLLRSSSGTPRMASSPFLMTLTSTCATADTGVAGLRATEARAPSSAMPTSMKTWDSSKGAVTDPGAIVVTHAKFDQFGNRSDAHVGLACEQQRRFGDE